MDQLQSHITSGLLIYGYIFADFLIYILGSPSSYTTSQPMPFEFPYIWGKFRFLFYQCVCTEYPCTLIGKHKQILPSQHLLFNLISLIHAILIRLVTRLCSGLLVSLWYALISLFICMSPWATMLSCSYMKQKYIKRKIQGPTKRYSFFSLLLVCLLKPMSEKNPDRC